MRRPLIAGNWKMNLNRGQARQLAESLAGFGDTPASVLVCPPFVWLADVSQALLGSAVAMGAQNLYFEPEGAFTGEISGEMLVEAGCQFVIVGHSERRHVLEETDEIVNRKVKRALAVGLQAILCVGETLAEREAGKTSEVVKHQLTAGLADIPIEQLDSIVIAYEPVWAIGTGKTASPEQAQEVHADLRKWLVEGYNLDAAESVRILYGGSVKPDNAASLLGQDDIDGALVGGASLDAVAFRAIVDAVSLETGQARG